MDRVCDTAEKESNIICTFFVSLLKYIWAILGHSVPVHTVYHVYIRVPVLKYLPFLFLLTTLGILFLAVEVHSKLSSLGLALPLLLSFRL